jgi:hypothetical protein
MAGIPYRDAHALRLDMRGADVQFAVAVLNATHRLFETSFPLLAPSCQRARGPVIGIYGAHVRDRCRPSGTNHKSDSNLPWADAFIAMGVPVGSMTLTELSEAIPLATRDSSSRRS